jgi:hypothetical protein
MADFVFNAAKGAVAEKIRDGASSIGILLLKTAQADATLKDHDDVAAMLAAGGGTANVECDFTSYARKTGITGTVTVDDANDRVDVSIPDQTWSPAGGATNNTTAKLIVYYQDSASDAGRVPLTAHDFVVTTDGSNLSTQFAASGFYRAS